MTTRIASTNIQSNTILTTNLASSTIATLQGSTVPTITQIQITTSSYVVKDDTAVSTSGGYIKITGTNFTAGSQVVIGSVPATSVGFVNSTTLNVQVPAQAAGTYVVYVTINTGSVAIIVNGLTYSGDPTWVTGSTLPGGQIDSAISIQLSATGDAPLTYALQAGSSLPSGLTLTSGGLLSGTVTGITVETTYNFTIEAIDGQAQESPRTFSITITSNDQYFDYVTTLLSASNPASTFVTDASTNNFAVSVFGDTRPNNFGPYTPGYYSNFFDGNADYLSLASNTAFAFGTGDFTVEAWIMRTGGSGNQPICQSDAIGTSTNDKWWFAVAGGGLFFGTHNAGGFNVVTTTTFDTNLWYHVAVSRSSGIMYMFVNGVSTAFTTSGTPSGYNLGQNGFTVGGMSNSPSPNYWTGYISNLRVTKGTALYTSSFTVSSTPLTAIASTSLLTCQSNRFIDASTNNFTITLNGDTLISGFDPFAPNSSYTSYGSGYFDGTGDYLSVPDNEAFNFTGDFTIECWLYPTSHPTAVYLIGQASSTDYAPVLLYLSNGRPGIGVSPNGSSWTINTFVATALTLNTWSHVAVVRSGNKWSIYVNGVENVIAASTAVTPYNSTDPLGIGGEAAGSLTYPYVGYMTDVRIVKGTAVYTTNFTPPAAPLTAVANTQLLTLQNNQPNNNSMFLDSSASNFLITRNGNTTQGSFSPYGGGWSNYFDGTGDFLAVPSNAALSFGTGDFTVECWVYYPPISNSNGKMILDARPTSTNGSFWTLGANSTGVVGFTTMTSGGTTVSDTTARPNQWVHYAATRSGTSLRLFANGTLVASATDSSNISSSGLFIGTNAFFSSAPDTFWLGYISNVRVIKGTAVYTSTFTPPTAPLTPIANTSLLTCADNRFVDDSANNFTLTRTGDVSIQRFNPFNPVLTTPTSYSGYFDGTGDYLNLTGSALGSGNFTIEAWVYLTSLPNAQNAIYSNGTGDNASATTAVAYVSSGGNLGFYNYPTATTTSSTISLNTWTHVAIVRNSGTITLYINGVSGATVSNSNNISDTAVQIMRGFGGITSSPVGYMSNLRVVVGTAVYTSNFTPSTTPLTAIANTRLLTLQNATFIDNSTNNYTITSNGDSVPRQFNPFGWTSTTGSAAAYSATNYGGSMYFDGTGDYLNLTGAAFGTGNFTLECWVNATSAPSDKSIFEGRTSGSGSTGFTLTAFTGTSIRIYSGTSALITASSVNYVNSWCHVAVVKSSGTTTLYINGVSVGTTTSLGNLTDTSWIIGAGRYATPPSVDAFFPGYISNFRIVRGQAVYSSNFAPPVSLLSFNANAVLQVNGTSAAIYDSSMITTYETAGNSISTGVIKKYGNSSMLFDGTGDYLFTPASANFGFGTGDFTIEFWLYLNSTALQTVVSFLTTASSTAPHIYIAAGGSIRYFTASADRITGSTLVTGTWYHVALSRSGSSTRMFINGTQAGSTYTDTNNYGASNPFLVANYGSPPHNSEMLSGYIDDLRITLGIARYNTNFTPPSSPVIQF